MFETETECETERVKAWRERGVGERKGERERESGVGVRKGERESAVGVRKGEREGGRAKGRGGGWVLGRERELVSSWKLMSCQPHRFISGQSNFRKKTHTSKPLIYKPFLQTVHKTNPYTNIKQNIRLQSLHKLKTKHTPTILTQT